MANAGFQNRRVCLQAFPSFPSPSPSFTFWLSFHFLRGQNRKSPSSVFFCSETKRKRVLRRLENVLRGCVFLGESKNEFMISDHMVSSITTNCKKERREPKKDHLHDINGMSSCCSMRKIEGKNNRLIIAVKTSMKCNITTYGYTKCVLFRFETQTFLEWNTP